MAITLAAILIVGTIGGMFYRDRSRGAEALLVHSQQALANQEFDNSIKHARDAWDEIGIFPWKSELKLRLKQQIATAEQGKATSALHNLVEQLRFLDDQPLNKIKLAEIAAGCAKVWQQRQRFILPPAKSENGEVTLDPQLRRDLLDLAVISARLEVQLASPDTIEGARRSAVQRLNEAQEICGASPWLTLEQREYDSSAASGNGEFVFESLPKPATSWEHYDLGRWLMRHGKLVDAEKAIHCRSGLEAG